MELYKSVEKSNFNHGFLLGFSFFSDFIAAIKSLKNFKTFFIAGIKILKKPKTWGFIVGLFLASIIVFPIWYCIVFSIFYGLEFVLKFIF